MNTYPAYKNSGVPWLGEIPAHWEALPNRAIFREIIEKNHPDERMLSVTIGSGVIPQAELLGDSSKKDSSNLDKSNYKLVESGDIAYNKMRAWQGAIGLSSYRGIVSPAYIIQRSRHEQIGLYFHHLYRTPAFAKEAERWSYGITSDQWSLRAEDFKQIYSSVPPLDEQAAIVKYFAHVDQKINRFIRAKRRMIELLNEQKQALIHQVVTKGLDPDVPIKDSGVEWLGEIPAHWEVITIGAASELIQTGPFGSQLHANDYVSGGTPVVNPSHMNDGNVVPDLDITIDQSTLDRLSRHLLRIGDIVLARRGELGRCAVITKMEEGWLCGTGSMTLRPRKNCLDSHYLLTIISSQGVKHDLSLSSVGSTMDNLNTSIVARQRVPKPPLSEQQCVIDSIRDESSKVERAVGRARAEIDLIREYRTRLVSDVVTGKVDVREVAAGLPEIEEADGVQSVDASEVVGSETDESLESEDNLADNDYDE